jgi:hypothetical protein
MMIGNSVHLSHTHTLVFFRILYILHDYKFDLYGIKVVNFLNKLESIDTAHCDVLVMYESFLSFIKLNASIITAPYIENEWNEVQVKEGNELHEALKHSLGALTHKDKDIMNQIVNQIACALELFPRCIDHPTVPSDD